MLWFSSSSSTAAVSALCSCSGRTLRLCRPPANTHFAIRSFTLPLLHLSYFPADKFLLGLPGLCRQGRNAVTRGCGRIRIFDDGSTGYGEVGSDCSMDLEDQIYDFMVNSSNPMHFPAKTDLIAAGRMDLVESIASHGGWLALGWDLEEHNHDEDVVERSDGGAGTSGGGGDDRLLEKQRFNDGRVSSSSDASSSGRPLDTDAREDVTGIQGILSRLEKQRSFSYGLSSLEKEGNDKPLFGSDDRDSRHSFGSSKSGNRSLSLDSGEDLFRELGHSNSQVGTFSDFEGQRTSSVPWSNQNSGFSLTKVEEMVPNGSRKEMEQTDLNDFSCSVNGNAGKDSELSGKKCLSQIHLRIEQLEAKLSSTLSLLRSKCTSTQPKFQESSGQRLLNLSDAWEFQENEIIKAHDKLRSTRAKLAVLEGKMAIDRIEAQKTMEDKQKRIDTVHKALQFLRTACIVWPNSASEVILTGSFDGWSSQRRMERSSTGIFSLHLKLYPGQYEIKFIVDGIWKIDPLRPVVNNNGYENNLLIIT